MLGEIHEPCPDHPTAELRYPSEREHDPQEPLPFSPQRISMRVASLVRPRNSECNAGCMPMSQSSTG